MPVFVRFCRHAALAGLLFLLISPANAQMGPSGPPVVGIRSVSLQPIVESQEVIGRIEAVESVDLVARVTAFLDEQNFKDGQEVERGDILYRLERGPYEADVAARRASVAQAEAQLENANITLHRAERLLKTSAGRQSTVDDARAAQRSATAQLQLARAELRRSEINLGYTEIRSPIDGRIGRTLVTSGNVVGPSSGTLATVVSQDPMYVTFPMPVRQVLDLKDRYAGDIFSMRIRLRLPNGAMYDQVGRLTFVDTGVARDTDTILLRGTIPNPPLSTETTDTGRQDRQLTDNEFVTVLVEAPEPVQMVAIPRAAVLTDQAGDYVYVIDDGNVARQRRVQLGQAATPETTSVTEGLSEGERIVIDGLQRVRPNAEVAPMPMTDIAGAPSDANKDGRP